MSGDAAPSPERESPGVMRGVDGPAGTDGHGAPVSCRDVSGDDDGCAPRADASGGTVDASARGARSSVERAACRCESPTGQRPSGTRRCGRDDQAGVWTGGAVAGGWMRRGAASGDAGRCDDGVMVGVADTTACVRTGAMPGVATVACGQQLPAQVHGAESSGDPVSAAGAQCAVPTCVDGDACASWSWCASGTTSVSAAAGDTAGTAWLCPCPWSCDSPCAVAAGAPSSREDEWSAAPT